MERANRLLVFCCLAALTLPIIAFSRSAFSEVPDVLKAQEFQLVGDKGETLATLKRDAGRTRLAFRGDGEKTRLMLSAAEDDAGLFLFTADEKRAAALRTTAQGPDLELFDEAQRMRALLRIVKNHGSLELLNESGKPYARLYTQEDGSALSLCDQDGTPAAYAYATKGAPRFVLQKEAEKALATLGLVNGIPWLQFNDKDGTCRVVLDATYHRPGLHLYHKNGKESLGAVGLAEWPTLVMFDEKGRDRIRLKMETAGPILEFQDASGKVTSQLPAKAP